MSGLELKIFKNSWYYLVASSLPTIFGFLTLPVFTRYLSPSDYGVVGLILSIQSFLPMIMTLQLNHSIPRFYFDYNNNTKILNTYISTLLLTVLAISSVVSYILLSNTFYIVSLFPSLANFDVLIELAIVSSMIGCFKSVFMNLLRVQNKARLFMSISIFLSISNVFISVLLIVYFNRGLNGLVESYLINNILSFILYFLSVKSFLSLNFSTVYLFSPIKYSLPLIPHSLASLIFLYSDRFILEKHVSIHLLGIYMFSDKLASVLKIFVNDFNNAFSPYFMEASKKSKVSANRISANIAPNFIFIISLIVLIVTLFSTEIIKIFDSKYFPAWEYFPLLCCGFIFRSLYCFSTSGLFYEKKTGLIALITFLSGLSNIF